MFDKLVESAKQKQGKRSRRFFLVTGLVYVVALTALGVATIVGFKPALAGEYSFLLRLSPPPPPLGNSAPMPAKPILKSAPNPAFVAPRRIEDLLPDYSRELNFEPSLLVPGAPSWIGAGRDDGVPGAPIARETPPPPPTTPTPVTKPTVTPTPDQAVRLTSALTQGRALRKVQPPYPEIARRAGVSGSVQVQINISEMGEVTSATLLSGHPLLREAALRTARQWLFIPTELNGRPVRAIGVITFNFTLN
jgi:protein TonB